MYQGAYGMSNILEKNAASAVPPPLLAAQDDAITAALGALSQHTDALSGLHTRFDAIGRKPPIVTVTRTGVGQS